MSRPADILQFLEGCSEPVRIATIIAAVSATNDVRREQKQCSHALGRLLNSGQIERAGPYGNYHYALRGRMPEAFVPPARPGRVPATRRERGPRAWANHATPAWLPPPLTVPRPSGARETVEEFIARNGRIQRLPMGATSQPLLIGRGTRKAG